MECVVICENPFSALNPSTAEMQKPLSNSMRSCTGNRPSTQNPSNSDYRLTLSVLVSRPRLIINLNPFLPIPHRNFNPNLCLSVSIMYRHCEL
jgi:hypothetical protein